MDGQKDEQMDRLIDGWSDGLIDGWVDWMDLWMFNRWMNGLIVGWIDWWMDGPVIRYIEWKKVFLLILAVFPTEKKKKLCIN